MSDRRANLNRLRQGLAVALAVVSGGMVGYVAALFVPSRPLRTVSGANLFMDGAATVWAIEGWVVLALGLVLAVCGVASLFLVRGRRQEVLPGQIEAKAGVSARQFGSLFVFGVGSGLIYSGGAMLLHLLALLSTLE